MPGPGHLLAERPRLSVLASLHPLRRLDRQPVNPLPQHRHLFTPPSQAGSQVLQFSDVKVLLASRERVEQSLVQIQQRFSERGCLVRDSDQLGSLGLVQRSGPSFHSNITVRVRARRLRPIPLRTYVHSSGPASV